MNGPHPNPLPAHRATRPDWPTRGLLLASAALLGVGLVGPCLTIVPGFGRYEGWVRLLDPAEARPTTYSVLGGILALIDHGSVGLGILLLAFSVFFPAAKLALLAAATAGARGGALLRLTHHAGKFSMLDVFVVALLILAVKGLPGDSEAVLGWGVYAFAASVVLGIVAGWRIESAANDDAASEAGRAGRVAQ